MSGWPRRRRAAAAPISLPAGALVVALAAVATFGHLTRHLVVVLRREPAHRNRTRNLVVRVRQEPGHHNIVFWS